MHKKLLDVVVNIFYNHHGKKLFRVDRNLFIGKYILLMYYKYFFFPQTTDGNKL